MFISMSIVPQQFSDVFVKPTVSLLVMEIMERVLTYTYMYMIASDMPDSKTSYAGQFRMRRDAKGSASFGRTNFWA